MLGNYEKALRLSLLLGLPPDIPWYLTFVGSNQPPLFKIIWCTPQRDSQADDGSWQTGRSSLHHWDGASSVYVEVVFLPHFLVEIMGYLTPLTMFGWNWVLVGLNMKQPFTIVQKSPIFWREKISNRLSTSDWAHANGSTTGVRNSIWC